MTSAIYLIYGLTIRSEVPMAAPMSPFDDAPDIEVLWEPVRPVPDALPDGVPVLEFTDAKGGRYSASHTSSGYVLRFHGAAEFAVAPDLASIRCTTDPGIDRDVVPILLAGTVLAFVLALRGGVTLHGSAVDVGGKALGFVGHSGMGKSTCAALLCAAGADVVTDDVLLVEVDDRGSALCERGASALRLRPTSTAVLDAFTIRPRTVMTPDFRTAIVEAPTARRRLPLHALLVPRPRRDLERARAIELSAPDALCELLRFPRVGEWKLDTPNIRQLEVLAAITQVVPTYVLDVPWGPPFHRRLAEEMLDLLGIDVSVEAEGPPPDLAAHGRPERR